MLAPKIEKEAVAPPTLNGYVSEGKLNEAVLLTLRERNVPEAFITDYISQIPSDCCDIEIISNWWVKYLSPHTSMNSVAVYLGNIRSPVSWVTEFKNSIPQFIVNQL